jgi:uncharacterized membrane protein YeiB
LDKYTGVYLIDFPNMPFANSYSIITREKDTLFFESIYSKRRLYPKSSSEFIQKNGFVSYSFHQDSLNRFTNLTIDNRFQRSFKGTRIAMALPEAQNKLAEQKAILKAAEGKQLSYTQFINRNYTWYTDRLRHWPWEYFIWDGYAISYVLVLFLLGMYAGRRKLFTNIEGNRLFYRRIMIWGLLLGTLGASVTVGTRVWQYLEGDDWKPFQALTSRLIELSWNLGIICMAFGYIAALILLVQKEKWQNRLSFLVPIGRMALTGFILQVIAYVFLFKKMSWCLGLGDKTGPFYRLLLAFGVVALLCYISRLWLNYFRMGPIEWLWRSITYWKWQPMKKKEARQMAIAA